MGVDQKRNRRISAVDGDNRPSTANIPNPPGACQMERPTPSTAFGAALGSHRKYGTGVHRNDR